MKESVAIIGDLKEKGSDFVKETHRHVEKKAKEIFNLELIDIETTRFEDGEFKEKIAENIRGRNCFFIHDSNIQPAKWFTKLGMIGDAVKYSDTHKSTIVLPYIRFSRQERKDESRVGVTAKVVAKIVSEYFNRGIAIDLHNETTAQLFDIPFEGLYSFPTLTEHLIEKHPEILEDLVVAAPDAGGAKRAESLAGRLAKKDYNSELGFAHKKRDGTGKIKDIKFVGDVNGKNVLFVDDIIATGGSLVKATQLAREGGAKKVYAYATHGLFTQGTQELTKACDLVMTSDTLHCEDDKIEVVTLAPLIGEAIYRMITNQSLSALFR